MQCGCPECGMFMGQDVRGASSRCVCPNCGYACDACLGTNTMMEKGSYEMPASFAAMLEKTEEQREEQHRKAMNAALNYLTAQDRTAMQMERHLKKRGFEQDEISAAMSKLSGYGYIDDRDYARRFVKQEVENKNMGKRAVAAKLYRSGIDRDTAGEYLDAVDDDTERENALYWARKFDRSVTEPDERKKRDKLARRLINKGFSYESINYALGALDDEQEEWE